MNDSKFLKSKIRLFQNVMVGKNCFCVVAIQSAKTGQRRETGGRGVEIPKRRTPSSWVKDLLKE